MSGTLEALIQHLVPTESYYPDRAFIFAFLLSSRLFIRPHELLGRVFRLAITTPTHSPKYVSHVQTISSPTFTIFLLFFYLFLLIPLSHFIYGKNRKNSLESFKNSYALQLSRVSCATQSRHSHLFPHVPPCRLSFQQKNKGENCFHI